MPSSDPSDNAAAKAAWSLRLGTEISFWDEWLASKGGRWASSFTSLLDHTRELEPQFKNLIHAPPRSVVKLLDVGAGPMTSLAVRWTGRHVLTIAVDPLAKEYEQALVRNSITPLVWTEFGEAERLSDQFLPDEFDLVHAANCIDHTYDPVTAIGEMLKVTKPGCCVVLEHAQNEGVFQAYDGLHQWNFDVEGGELLVWNPGSRVSVSQRFSDVCSAEVRLRDAAEGRKWVSAYLRKHPVLRGDAPAPPAV